MDIQAQQIVKQNYGHEVTKEQVKKSFQKIGLKCCL